MSSMPRNRKFVVAGVTMAALGLGLISCSATTTINGAGASFPAAMYLRWFQELSTQGVKVNYQSIGSGAGVRQFTARSVDFGASDVALSGKEIAAIKTGVLQLPMTAGAIAVAYNNSGCSLKLSQLQLAKIFLGAISNYSQVGCKSKPIRVVHRSDGSGTTANFTAHLSAISPEWQQGPGHGKSVAWPSGIGAKGNEGMASQISQLDGGIGYLESVYVKGSLQAASLTNASGQLVSPTQESEKESLASITLDDKLTGSNPNPAKGYPIVSLTWILLNQQGNGVKLESVKKAFEFTLSDQAQSMAPQLGYITLPADVLVKARKALAAIR